MALIKCPECNKEISDTTKRCPSCGYKFHIKNRKIIYTIISIVIVCIIIISGLILYIHSTPIYQYKTQAISILTNYRNNTISSKEAKEQLDNLYARVNDEKKQDSKLLGLKIKINSASIKLINGLSITEINKYINDFKQY